MPSNYYLLRQDAWLGRWRAVSVDGVSLDAFRAGLPIDVPGAPARVTVDPGDGMPSDYFERPCLVVSDAMRCALDRAGVDNVEYFPTRLEIEHSGEPARADFWLANVVGAVACAVPLSPEARRRRVERGVAPGPSPGFAVDPARARDFPLFRLAEDRRLLVVSERVARALDAAGLQGIRPACRHRRITTVCR